MWIKSDFRGFLRRTGLSLSGGLVAAVGVSWPVSASPIAYNVFNEWDATSMVSGLATPFDIVTGPDGNIWWTAPDADAVVKVSSGDGSLRNTYYAPGCHPTGITIGPDRNLWVACFASDVILRVTVDGAMTSFPLPVTPTSRAAGGHQPAFLTSGPDGFLWFTENNLGYVSKLNVTTASLWEFPIPSGAGSLPRGIVVGQDGNLWFTEYSGNKIGRVTTLGVFTQYPVPTASSGPLGLTVARDGNIYFAEDFGNKIGRITMSGAITEYAIQEAGTRPQYIAIGPGGNLWFSQRATSSLNTLNLASVNSGYPDPSNGFGQKASTPTQNSAPGPVAAGPDGNLWFSETGANKIARTGTRYAALSVNRTALGFGKVAAGRTSPPQTVVVNDTGPGAMRYVAFDLQQTTFTGGSFSISGGTCRNPPYDTTSQYTCSFDVVFTASEPGGTVTGTLTIFVSAIYSLPYRSFEEQALVVDLSATGVGSNCGSTSMATDKTSPQTPGTNVTATATSTGCPDPNPLYRFYLRTPDGAWKVVQDFGTNASFTWNTTGYEPATYMLGVWVKDAKSSNTYDAYAFATFTLSVSGCLSANLASDGASPKPAGATVNFTATSTGCPAPLYQWWVRDTAGAWRIAVPFAAGATFAWNTTGSAAGTYQVGVWAKQAGSTASYDAFSFTTFTLTSAGAGAACQSAGVTGSPGSPSSVGTAAAFSAASTGCPSPQYRWWINDTSGRWSIVQDYPPGAAGGASFNWSTAALPGGTYQVGVWARQAGSTASYEAYSLITYTLTNGRCIAASISAAPAQPQAPGSSITLIGSGAGCSSPEFRFWLAPPQGSFAESRPYMSGNSFTWDTTGWQPGTYQVGIWARQTGSGAAYEAFAIATFQLSDATTTSACPPLWLWPSNTLGGDNHDLSQSPEPSGPTYFWRADTTGTCVPTAYSFYVQAPWGAPRLMQASGVSNLFAWNTAGLPTGNYKILVFARYAGGTFDYPFATSQYELI